MQIKGLADVNDTSYTPPSTSSNYSDRSPVVACVGLEKLAETCDSEGIEAYLVTWKDVTGPCVKGNVESLIGAILESVMDEERVDPVTFPPKYTDFANVFDKHCANILAEHSQHDLAIKIKRDKVPLFGTTYNHSKPELEVLCEYINEMLEKRFIGAQVLFTKKTDGGL